jgi:hypothetical protein
LAYSASVDTILQPEIELVSYNQNRKQENAFVIKITPAEGYKQQCYNHQLQTSVFVAWWYSELYAYEDDMKE